MFSMGINEDKKTDVEWKAETSATAIDAVTPRRRRNQAIRILIPVAWSISGAIVGLAVAVVLGWSAPLIALAVLVGAALSWLGRGIGPVVAMSMLWLAVVALLLQAATVLAPDEQWSVAWLAPLLVLAVGASLWAGRLARIGWLTNTRAFTTTVDFAAALASLGWAVVFVRHLATVGSTEAVRFLLRVEDNAAWMNTVGTLSGPHGVVISKSTSFDTFGPVTTTFLGIVRHAIGVGSAAPLSAQFNAQTVLAAHALLILAAPLVATVLARRVLPRRGALLALLAWGTAATLIGAWCIVLTSYGFLSASLAMLLVVVAACSAAERSLGVNGWRPLLGWFVVAFLLYGAAASWVALVPLGGVVIAGWCVALLSRRGSRPSALSASVLAVCLVALLMEWALLWEYRSVTGPIGGGQALLATGGSTPTVTSPVLAVALALLALGWLGSPVPAEWPVHQSPLFRSLLWLAAYLVLVSLVEGATTPAGPYYGSTKLLFVFAGAWLTLAVVDVLASHEIGRRSLDASFAVALAVLVASTVQSGPVFTAAQSHWPKAEPSPAWLSVAQLEIATGGRVVCLSTQVDHPGDGALPAYMCSRWAASLAGQDGQVALTWRFAMLGRQPVSDTVSDIRTHRDLPWKVLVIGGTDRLCDRAAWWAPIVAEPGIELIHVPVSKPTAGTGLAPTSHLSCAAR